MNSIIRPRRLRRTEAIREMVRENHLTASDFIYPLFIHEKDLKEELEDKNFKTNLNLIQTYKSLTISEGMRLEPNNPIFLLKGKK